MERQFVDRFVVDWFVVDRQFVDGEFMDWFVVDRQFLDLSHSPGC